MASSGSFRVRFDAMVATLRAHPRVEVYEVEVRPPATEVGLAEAEEEIGMPLPAEVRAFYAAHDGVFLEWGLRGREYEARTPAFGYPDYGQPPGCINLVPVREAMSGGWEADSHVNVIQPDHQALLFGAPLDPPPKVAAACIDNFSKYNHGDMIFGPEPVMVVSTDHGADMDSSDYTSFSTYLDMTLALWGVSRYSHGVGIGWTRKPERVTAWTKRPTLDEIIAELEKDAD
jgi:hypothetical protein